jgi:hypothetical protein
MCTYCASKSNAAGNKMEFCDCGNPFHHKCTKKDKPAQRKVCADATELTKKRSDKVQPKATCFACHKTVFSLNQCAGAADGECDNYICPVSCGTDGYCITCVERIKEEAADDEAENELIELKVVEPVDDDDIDPDDEEMDEMLGAEPAVWGGLRPKCLDSEYGSSRRS